MTEKSQIDADVKIPAAVKAAAARSDELFNTYRDKPQGEPASEQDNAPQEVTPEGNSELDAGALTQAPAQDARNEPATPAAEQDNQPTSTTDSAADDETWEHKYKSIHGRYTRSQEQVRTLTDQVQNLQNIIASMQSSQPREQESQLPELDAERLVTEEEIADYGEDFLKVVGKRAREEMAPVINAYKDEIAKLQKQLQGFDGFVKQDTQSKLLTKLDEKLPNWRELNTNQEFLDWLGLPDPYSGAIRHDMLKAAYAQGDSHRVMAFFNGFLAEEAAVAPAKGEPDPSVTKVPKVPLESLAAPGRAKTAAASPAPAEKPIITRAQVAAFYADVAAGKYRGKDDAKNRAEAEIFSAQADGRIR